MVDFIADYLTNIRSRRVFPNVKPGYMRPMIDEEAPTHGEPWEDIFKDIERVIMPGVCITNISNSSSFTFFFFCSIGYSLAISIYACLFSGIKFLSIITWSRVSIFFYMIYNFILI